MGWLLTPGLLACERPASTTTERIPAVKTIAVRAETPTTERVLSGMLTVGDETRLSFAIGGTLVEVYRDVAFRVPPFDRDEARRMVAGLAGVALLRGVRGGAPLDIEALLDVVLAVQQLALDLGGLVAEVDLNPVLVRPSGAVVLDALVVASDDPADTRGGGLPDPRR